MGTASLLKLLSAFAVLRGMLLKITTFMAPSFMGNLMSVAILSTSYRSVKMASQMISVMMGSSLRYDIAWTLFTGKSCGPIWRQTLCKRELN
jgi:Flp pilus assembly protein protease CpaA